MTCTVTNRDPFFTESVLVLPVTTTNLRER